MNIEKKVKPTRTCQDGKHTFIVTAWNVRPSQKTATVMTCQHCLCTADKPEREHMMNIHNERARKAAESTESA